LLFFAGGTADEPYPVAPDVVVFIVLPQQLVKELQLGVDRLMGLQ